MDQRTVRFSKLLRKWRGAQKLKLEAAARQLGVSVSAWNHWETGQRLPSMANLFAIADLLNIPAQCLICAKNEVCSVALGSLPCNARALCARSVA